MEATYLELIGELYSRGLIRTWLRDRPEGWELTSGAWSPFYFMFREVPFFPDLFKYSVDALSSLVREFEKRSGVDALVGVASTGIPLAAGVALQTKLPLAFTRKIAGLRTADDLHATNRSWGDHSLVEGRFENGMRYLLIDDVVTGGASKGLAKLQVEVEAESRGLDLVYCGTMVVVDRGFPGHAQSELVVQAKHRLYDELSQITEFGGSQREVLVIKRYLEDPNGFQAPTKRSLLLQG